jgi:hypothetical protein
MTPKATYITEELAASINLAGRRCILVGGTFLSPCPLPVNHA